MDLIFHVPSSINSRDTIQMSISSTCLYGLINVEDKRRSAAQVFPKQWKIIYRCIQQQQQKILVGDVCGKTM